MSTPKITFVSIVNANISNTETIEADSLGAVERRISKYNDSDVGKAVCIYGDGSKWDINFPMTKEQISKEAKRLFKTVTL